MKVVLLEDAIRHVNSENSVSLEYENNDKDINIAVVEISGRYPDKGRMMNTVCKELIYIIDGNGQIFIEGNKIQLKTGDTILIEPYEKYYWEGKLKVIPACTPAWNIEQVKMCED